MNIYYFDGTQSKFYKAINFGDELNPWLWPQVFPGILEAREEVDFIGIGTLLNDRLPKTSQKVIFGSGVGYGNTPQPDHTWEIYFVRGLLSAKSLGIDFSFGITDPGILVRRFFIPSDHKRYKWSYMPHYKEDIINGNAWKEICADLDIHYISPTEPLQKVLTEISETEVLLTEAMHGAITADALRTPWVAIKTHSRILEFKWNDWLSTLEIPYHPIKIWRKASIIEKSSLFKYLDYHAIRAQFALTLKTIKPNLSNFSKTSELEEKIMYQVDKFKDHVLKA